MVSIITEELEIIHLTNRIKTWHGKRMKAGLPASTSQRTTGTNRAHDVAQPGPSPLAPPRPSPVPWCSPSNRKRLPACLPPLGTVNTGPKLSGVRGSLRWIVFQKIDFAFLQVIGNMVKNLRVYPLEFKVEQTSRGQQSQQK